VSTTRREPPEWLLLTACSSPVPQAQTILNLARDQDWNRVFAAAEKHGVTNLLAARLSGLAQTFADARTAFLSAALTQLKARQRNLLFSAMAMTAELLRLLDRFSSAGVGAVPVKGPVLALRAYGDPGMRHYADLDLLVRHSEVARATQLLVACGYNPWVSLETIALKRIPGEYAFTHHHSSLRVELHTERTLRYYPRPVSFDELFLRRKPVLLDGRSVAALSPEDDLLMLCVHGAKDLWERLIWVADIAGLLHREPAMDWSLLFAEARRLGALRMLNIGLLLAAHVLQISLPAGGAEARCDSGAAKLARQLAAQMNGLSPAGEAPRLHIARRALLRLRMRGGILSGVPYLLRLTFSPAEDDWRSSTLPGRILDSPRRLFRLAAKYGRKDQM